MKKIIVVIVLLVLGGIGFASMNKNLETQKRELEKAWRKVADFSTVLYRISDDLYLGSQGEVSAKNLLPFLATNIRIGIDAYEFNDLWVISRKTLGEELDFYLKFNREKNNFSNDTEKFVKNLVERVNVIALLMAVAEVGTYISLNGRIMKVQEGGLLPVDKDSVDFGEVTSVFNHEKNGEIFVRTKGDYDPWWCLTLIKDKDGEWKIKTLIY